MARQETSKSPKVATVPIRRADKKMWLRQHGGSFEKGDIKGEFSSCFGCSGGPIGIIDIKRGDELRSYVIDLQEFVETVLEVEENLKSPK